MRLYRGIFNYKAICGCFIHGASHSGTAAASHYAILGVSPEASHQDIKDAFRRVRRKACATKDILPA